MSFSDEKLTRVEMLLLLIIWLLLLCRPGLRVLGSWFLSSGLLVLHVLHHHCLWEAKLH